MSHQATFILYFKCTFEIIRCHDVYSTWMSDDNCRNDREKDGAMGRIVQKGINMSSVNGVIRPISMTMRPFYWHLFWRQPYRPSRPYQPRSMHPSPAMGASIALRMSHELSALSSCCSQIIRISTLLTYTVTHHWSMKSFASSEYPIDMRGLGPLTMAVSCAKTLLYISGG